MEIERNRTTKIYVLKGKKDEDLLEIIKKAVKEKNIRSALFTCIGALQNCALAFYDLDKKKYIEIRKNKGFEIASCMGNIALGERGEFIIHSHMVLSDKEGKCIGGHVLPGNKVAGTVEIMLFELSRELHREFDPETGLKTLKLEEPL